jgi:hypothetical protein
MYMDVDKKITSMYENIDYLGMYGNDVLYSFLLIAFTIFIVSMQSYYALLNELKTSWNLHRCNPIVMPFAGHIMPKPGQTSTETTYENFNYCVYQDVSAVFSIIMMPLEFVLFLTIQSLEVTLDSTMQLLSYLTWLKKSLGNIFEKYYEKLVNFIIPVIEITMYMRDMMGKINGVIVTAFFTIINIYNLTISGLMNIMTILINILIIIIAVVVTLMGLSAAMMLSVFLFPGGVALTVVFGLILVGVVLPAIIICLLLQAELKDTFNEGSPTVPSAP